MFIWVKCYRSFQREVLLYGLAVIRHDNKVAKVLVSDGKVCSPEDLVSENGVQRYGDSDDDVPTDGVPVDCICDDGVPTDGALILLVNTRKDLCFYIRHDNKALKDLFSDSSKLGRTLHWRIAQAYPRFLFQAGTIVCVWWDGTLMCADMLTKSLQFPRMSRHRRVLMGE